MAMLLDDSGSTSPRAAAKQTGHNTAAYYTGQQQRASRYLNSWPALLDGECGETLF